jgi:hypothetical protein
LRNAEDDGMRLAPALAPDPADSADRAARTARVRASRAVSLAELAEWRARHSAISSTMFRREAQRLRMNARGFAADARRYEQDVAALRPAVLAPVA